MSALCLKPGVSFAIAHCNCLKPFTVLFLCSVEALLSFQVILIPFYMSIFDEIEKLRLIQMRVNQYSNLITIEK